MSKIKVLFLHAGAELYGADKVLLELVSNIDKRRFDPIVILPNDGILREKLEQNDIRVSIIPYPVLRRKYFNFIGIISYLYNYLKYSKKLSKIVDEQKVEIVHSNTTAVLEGVFLKKNNKIKLVWHIHEIILKPKFIYNVTSYLIGKYSDKVVVVSNAVKDHLLSSKYIKKDNLKVVYNGVDNNQFYPGQKYLYLKNELSIPKNYLVVGMIGRINSWKGQTDFLEAMEIVVNKDSNKNKKIIGVMVGDVFEGEDIYKENLEEEVRMRGMSDIIRIVPFRNDVASFYNLFDLFILPSIRPDPLPTVVLEAMASGKPIVSYNHGGAKEMVENNYNGLLVTPRNTGQLAKAIIRLCDNPTLRLTYGNNSIIRQKELFSKIKYIDSFENIYENM